MKLQQGEISIEFELKAKFVSETGPMWHTYLNEHIHHRF